MAEKLMGWQDEYLGHQSIDPHGDPISDTEGKIADATGRPLSEFQPDETVTVIRICDQEPEFIDFVANNRLRSSAVVQNRSAGSVTVQAEGFSDARLSFAAAE